MFLNKRNMLTMNNLIKFIASEIPTYLGAVWISHAAKLKIPMQI